MDGVLDIVEYAFERVPDISYAGKSVRDTHGSVVAVAMWDLHHLCTGADQHGVQAIKTD